MAGRVRTDAFAVPGTTVIDLVARVCPAVDRYGEVCLRYDGHTGAVALCPFWYGLEVASGTWHVGNARSIGETASLMSTGELYTDRHHTVLCLRMESKNTPAGAARPRTGG